MSSEPIPCRYYHLINNGIGIKIWPDLRDANDHSSLLWEGRNHDGFGLNIGGDETVDLSIVDMAPGTLFILSENTLFGTDMWETNQVFSYDPTSTVTVNAVRSGGVDDGSLTYTGMT
ncbi:hypothetical protein LCI18_010565 [Fusarium solani-melongenae]|uniref:Uncharacterized protein n=1 Tax=Fusarium solani subsp. cucurbitae TaxID=2747967 RepID=A0ACD3ZEH7_FUSSC|nr:hypothetical protein LCI18_010565 [Fusarium solani-melongenae]